MNKLLGNLPQGLIFVISAPAGTGKTTLARMLAQEFPCVVESISCTTRSPRTGEVDGKDYHFLSEQEFKEKIQAGDFLEYAHVFGHLYGTSRSDVVAAQKKGKHVVLVIDTQGASQIRGKVDATFIFISPPSLDVLRERLIQRKTDSPEMIEKRLSWAQGEIAQKGSYDYHIVNDNLQVAYQVLRSILIAQEHKITKETP
jgi:guanylate kinase